MTERCAYRAWRSVVAVAAAALMGGCGDSPEPTRVAPETQVQAARGSAPAAWLQGDTTGYLIADRPRDFVFPMDHGPHPGYRTEWWYLTGHLRTTAPVNRDFGFQFTVFRQALRPPTQHTLGAERIARSAWRADDAMLAHLAITDVAGGSHRSAARMARSALGLGGARWRDDGALAIAVDGWQLDRRPDESWHVRAVGQATTSNLDEERELRTLGLALRFVPQAPVLLHGERGLSRKGPNSASYYYSLPRLATVGRLRYGDAWLDVHGEAWLDREWSTSALAPEQRGWDWFSLALDDGSELMLFRLRRHDGGRDPYNAGTWRRGGETRALRAGDFALRPLAHWRDERGRDWPVAWQIDLPSLDLQLEVRAVVADQLMRVGLEYWEGAVAVSGDRSGRGYLEATGY